MEFELKLKDGYETGDWIHEAEKLKYTESKALQLLADYKFAVRKGTKEEIIRFVEDNIDDELNELVNIEIIHDLKNILNEEIKECNDNVYGLTDFGSNLYLVKYNNITYIVDNSNPNNIIYESTEL